MANAAPQLVTDGLPYEVVCSSSDEREWLEARKSGIGASEIACVLGINPWKSDLTLYAEKVGAVEPEDLSDVERVEWGKLLEPVIVQVFGKRAVRQVRAHGTLLRSTEHPWALATLDAECSDDGQSWWPLEIKTTSAFNADDWAEGPPEHYAAQVQQQLLVTGAAKATVACLLGGQRLVWCDVERDETTIRKIAHQGERFWQRVLDRNPPAPDGSYSARQTLHALFPHDTGEVVVLGADVAETVDEWQQLKRQQKALEQKITAAENTIKAALGNASRAAFPAGDGVSWKEQHRAEVVLPATSFRVLRYHPNKNRKGRA